MEKRGKCQVSRWVSGLSIGLFCASVVFAECGDQGECGDTSAEQYENDRAKQFAQKFLNYSPESDNNRKKKLKPGSARLSQDANPGLSLSAIESANRALESGAVAMKHNQQANVIFPEQTQTIAMSAKDRNRFVCTTGEMQAVRYSEEKFVLSEIDGNEAYVKLEFEVSSAGEINYSEIPTDIFFKCGGETYSIIAQPSPGISAKTFYLVSPAAQSAAARKQMDHDFNALSIDDAIARIVELTMKDETPPAWSSLPLENKKSPVDGVFLEQTGNWYIRSIEAHVSLYRAYAARDVEVTEWDFLTPELAVNPVGIAVRHHRIPAGQYTPVVIVQKVREKKSSAVP